VGPPEKVCLAPGNHDTYASESWINLQAEWGGYLPEGGVDGFPLIKRIGGVLLLSLSSAVPTRPISACGLVGRGQMERLRTVLDESTQQLRVLMLHHPPLPGMVQFRKRLRDARRLEQALGSDGVDVVFYGHRHRNLTTERLGARLFCTAPASAEAGAFRQLDIEPLTSGWQLEQSLVARAGAGRFEIVETTRWQVSGRD
jgi:3',5'-cyclic AMP phosphodiesterase CpdA